MNSSPYALISLTRTAVACAYLTTLVTPSPGRADTNDTLLELIRDYCLHFRGTPDAALARAMKSGLDPRGAWRDKGPPYTTEVGLVEIPGAVVMTFSSGSKSRPVSACRFVAYSDDMAELAQRMTEDFALGDEFVRAIDNWRDASGRASFGGRTFVFRLEYGLQDNRKAGAFTLTVNRARP